MAIVIGNTILLHVVSGARKRKCGGPAKKLGCPICGSKLIPNESEVDCHIHTELYRLEKAVRYVLINKLRVN